MSINKSKLTTLEMTFPPVSAQEAVQLQSDPYVESLLRDSDFYIIAGRAESKFSNIHFDENSEIITFDIVIAGNLFDQGSISLNQRTSMTESTASSYFIETGEKFIQVWPGLVYAGGSCLDWFTPESVIWERSRGEAGIHGLDRYREATVYDLLYVGIAKVGDSFDRLIKGGHKAKAEILANEPQRYPGARPADEIYLFMFKVQSLFVNVFSLDHDLDESDFSGNRDVQHKRIVADAEKAFVSLLSPSYNAVRFKSYPRGADGLYESGYDRYLYTINENIEFNTARGSFRGGRDTHTGYVSNDGDSLFIDGQEAHILTSDE